MEEGIFDTLLRYVDQGGHVMPPLFVGLFVLWYAIGYRAVTLRRGHHRHVREILDAYRKGWKRRPRGIIDRAARQGVRIGKNYPRETDKVLDETLFCHYQDVKKGRTLILSIVTIAPLVGLLGTVSGMIETFSSLGDMSLFAQSGGIAGGISQALLTTQMGLCVAVPGVVVGRLLDRRQRAIEEELDQLKALIGGTS